MPEAALQEGSVVRDLFVEGPAAQLSLLYGEVASISNLQSYRLVSGSDLEKLGQNLGAAKKAAAKSSGTALLTFSSLPATIGINSGEIITAQNGATFAVINGLSVDSAKANYYRSIATKYQDDLAFLNITDQYAVEVSVRATVPGVSGNIPKYSLNRTSIPGISNVTNTFAFLGGSNQEDDTSYRNRVLAIFSGSNIGTALGYKNTALTNSFVLDALVISPGDILMRRDGTQVTTQEDGTEIILSEGTGGKVDVVILGSNINQNIDTFIYRDKSNNNDPTDSANDIVLGQITGDENKTITRKRIDNIANGTLPSQPVEEIVEVTGSLSGANFLPKSTDELGRVTGNYELIKDTGVYAGSPWAQDRFVWISDKVSLFSEDLIKSQLNSQDATTFTDVIEIPSIQQSITISNENSTVLSSDRSIVKLLHTPASSVSRVLNSNTGERYTVVNQNLDGTAPFNTTGRIKISGNTLPSSSDILQVDYTWIIDYDSCSDYDGKIISNNPRSSIDSIDWGLSNCVRSEKTKFTLNTDGTFYSGTVSLPVSSVIKADTYKTSIGKVEASSVVNFSDRLAITLTSINSQSDNIESVKLANTQKELYATASNDGLYVNNRVVVGSEIKYNITILLPTDTEASIGDYVDVIFNTNDVFNVTGSTGSFIDGNISVPSANIDDTPTQINLLVTYLSSAQDILSYGVSNLPISREGNGFSLNKNTGGKNSITSNSLSRQNQTVQKDVSNNYYIKLSLSSQEYSLSYSDIITVMNIANGEEFWNSDGYGSLSIDTDQNYKVILSGVNSPAVGDQVLIVYSAKDIQRAQPFTFKNNIIKYNVSTLSYNFTTNNFYCPLNDFTVESSLSFDIVDPTTGNIISTASDGYITDVDDGDVVFYSLSYDFSSLSEINSKRIQINNSVNVNNNGLFNIIEYIDADSVRLSPIVGNISTNQISVIRLSDNKDLWSETTGSISNNRLNFGSSLSASQGQRVAVFFFTNENLRQAPTRLSVTLSDQLNNSGIITASGTTLTRVSDAIFTATKNGLTQNVLEAMKDFLGLNSTNLISSDNTLVRVLKVEKVLTSTNDEVISSVVTYDSLGTEIYNDTFYSHEMNINRDLSTMEFTLPNTVNNIDNAPVIGDKIRISFVYATAGDTENIYFTKNGTLYTNKKFAIINKLFISSGFNSSQSARFTVSLFTQPAAGSRYRVFYDYVAPKQNERVLIRTNFNQAISDTTFAIETSRPINADVLVRAANKILVDATVNIVVKTEYIDSKTIVLQNVKDRITTTINTNILGDSINSSDLISAAQTVDGVDRARIVYFNVDEEVGQVLTITAKKDEYFSANDIVIQQENR